MLGMWKEVIQTLIGLSVVLQVLRVTSIRYLA